MMAKGRNMEVVVDEIDRNWVYCRYHKYNQLNAY